MLLDEKCGINDEIYMNSGWMSEEAKEQYLEIKEARDINPESIEIKVEVVTGRHKGKEHNQRYWLTKAKRDPVTDEVLSKGGYWRFRFLAIACGEYTLKPNNNGEMKPHIKLPFNTDNLKGKRFIGDFKYLMNKNKGREYLNLLNEKTDGNNEDVSQKAYMSPDTLQSPDLDIGAAQFNQAVEESQVTKDEVPF